MIKLHHLNKSRSKRILWLLEELGVPYEVVAYQRNPQTRVAPPQLAAIHPLGKSPVLDDGGRVIAESGAITEYLTATYGADTLQPVLGSDAYVQYLQWLHFAEGSAVLPMLLGYFLTLDGCKTRFLGDYAAVELDRILRYLDASVATGPYLVGDQFTAADILNSFVPEQLEAGGKLGAYPHLREYLARIQARPAAARANALDAKYGAR